MRPNTQRVPARPDGKQAEEADGEIERRWSRRPLGMRYVRKRAKSTPALRPHIREWDGAAVPGGLRQLCRTVLLRALTDLHCSTEEHAYLVAFNPASPP